MQVIPAEKGWYVLSNASVAISDLVWDDEADLSDVSDLIIRLHKLSDPVIAWGIEPDYKMHRFFTPTWAQYVDEDTLFFAPDGRCCYDYLDLDLASLTLADIDKWADRSLLKGETTA